MAFPMKLSLPDLGKEQGLRFGMSQEQLTPEL
jgi:hypothetical protein